MCRNWTHTVRFAKEERLRPTNTSSVCNIPAIRERHNEVVKRLVKAIPKDLGMVYLDQPVPGAPDGTLRPDVVINNDTQKKTHLVDVAAPMRML